MASEHHNQGQQVVLQKRRSACDKCHQAKVKCSGEPTCIRCVERDFECRYSDASKAGKPKGSRNRKTLGRLHQLREREREKERERERESEREFTSSSRTRRPLSRDISLDSTPTKSLRSPNSWSWSWYDDAYSQDLWQANWSGASDADINEDILRGTSLDDIGTENNHVSDHVRLGQPQPRNYSSTSSSGPPTSTTSTALLQDLTNDESTLLLQPEAPTAQQGSTYNNFSAIGSHDLSSFIFDNVANTSMFQSDASEALPSVTSACPMDKAINFTSCICFERITKSLNNLYISNSQLSSPGAPKRVAQYTRQALASCRDFFSCSCCPTDGFSLLLVLSTIRLVLRSLEDLIIPSAVISSTCDESDESGKMPANFSCHALLQSNDILELLSSVIGRSKGEGGSKALHKIGGKPRKHGTLEEPTESDLAYLRLTISRQEGVLELLNRTALRREMDK